MRKQRRKERESSLELVYRHDIVGIVIFQSWGILCRYFGEVSDSLFLISVISSSSLWQIFFVQTRRTVTNERKFRRGYDPWIFIFTCFAFISAERSFKKTSKRKIETENRAYSNEFSFEENLCRRLKNIAVVKKFIARSKITKEANVLLKRLKYFNETFLENENIWRE